MPCMITVRDDALRFITGFELKHGRSPNPDELSDGVFGGDDGLADIAIRLLVNEGRLRRAPHSRRRKLQVLHPMPVPRAPDGEPLHFVRKGESAA